MPMSVQTPAPQITPREREEEASNRLSGPRLFIARATWITLFVLAVALVIGGIPDQLERLSTVSRSSDLGQVLDRLGFSSQGYAWYITILDIIEAVGFLAIGVVIFARKPDDVLGLTVSLTLVLFGAADAQLYDTDWRLLFEALQATSEVLTLLLFLLFPNGRFYPKWSRYLGIIAVVWVIVVHTFHDYMPPQHLFGTTALWTTGLFAQIHRYRHVSGPARRQQTKWIVWGLSLTFAVYLAYAFPDAWSVGTNVPWLSEGGRFHYLNLLFIYPVRRLGVLMAPLSFIIAIMRYRLWDIDLVINRSLVYGALTAFLAALFGGSLFLISQVFQAMTGSQQSIIAIAASALVFGALFQPTRRSLQRFVDRRFFGIQIDYQKKPDLLDSARELSNSQFSAYTALELIGRGGMAKVYKAQHPKLNRVVAIKILDEHLVKEADFRRRFEREAQTVASLKHPNIVQMFDYGEAGGMYYMVMEYISGPDLSSFLRQQGAMPLAQAFPLIHDVASALDHAHDQGLVHRDIKPSNVMLDPVTNAGPEHRGYRAVLMDFGLAKIVGGSAYLTQAGVLGTFSYVAPEQIRAASNVDRRADVYGLGVMAFKMLTGGLPFKHQHPSALLIAHLTQPPPDPQELEPNIPDHAADALVRAMAKSPGDRYPTAGAFADALAATGDR